MSRSLWRYSHLILAICASLFLLSAALSGSILALEPFFSRGKAPSYRIGNEYLSDVIPLLKEKYLSISSLEVDENQNLIITASESPYSSDRFFVDPQSGAPLGEAKEASVFFQWMTSFHRSLFLGKWGRFFIGLTAFLLIFISLTGFVITLKKGFFWKGLFQMRKEASPAAQAHTLLGKFLFIPLFVIGVTGTFLFSETWGIITPPAKDEELNIESSDSYPLLPLKDFEFFRTTRLSQIKKIDFPFSDFPEDYFSVETPYKKLIINQFNGDIITERHTDRQLLFSQLMQRIHTGKGNLVLSLIWLVSGWGIIFFIYSGFRIFGQRKGANFNNRFHTNEAEYIVLFGSENGSTIRFASTFFEELLRLNFKVYIAEMNAFTSFPKMKHLIIITSTYGNGQAPENAKNFIKRWKQNLPKNKFYYSVLGLGSRSYPRFCQFAFDIEKILKNHPIATSFTDLFTINNQSFTEFQQWLCLWFSRQGISHFQPPQQLVGTISRKTIRFQIDYHSKYDFPNENFYILHLKPSKKISFRSGDLIGITPEDGRERLYSVGKTTSGTLLLCIKKHLNGVVSQQLLKKEIGDDFYARKVSYDKFHLPNRKHSFLFVATGTGIAPFIGMLNETPKISAWIVWGGKKRQAFLPYEKELSQAFHQKKIHRMDWAFSEEDGCKKNYVQDLLQNNRKEVARLLNDKGTIMICGSLSMQKEVQRVLADICEKELLLTLEYFQDKQQILWDCY